MIIPIWNDFNGHFPQSIGQFEQFSYWTSQYSSPHTEIVSIDRSAFGYTEVTCSAVDLDVGARQSDMNPVGDADLEMGDNLHCSGDRNDDGTLINLRSETRKIEESAYLDQQDLP